MPEYGVKTSLYGRKAIYSDVDKITRENVVSVLDKAKSAHKDNVTQIDYLWDMYRGKQDIRNRTKEVRSDIINKICENRAYQIVTFEVGYLIGKPISYVTPIESETNAVNLLNSFMQQENKAAEDQRLVMWQKICGTAYRLVLQKEKNEPGESPFEITTVEPRNAFVIYSAKIGHKPLGGVYTYKNDKNKDVYCIYTSDAYFEVVGKEIVRSEANALGLIPLIEYPANEARLGSIEIVAPLLDEINLLDSDRMDSVEQFVQALLVFINCQPPEGETSATLAEKGIIALPSSGNNKADLKMIAEQLDQTQTQILKKDIYQSILEIVGMPSISDGGTSDSSNNGAVILKNGWQNAEAKAEASENVFKASERETLRVVLRICRDLSDIGEITLSNLEVYFPRQNYGDLQAKAQVLTMLLGNDKVHPEIAYEICRLFRDPATAYTKGMEWYSSEKEAIEKTLSEDDGEDDDV